MNKIMSGRAIFRLLSLILLINKSYIPSSLLSIIRVILSLYTPKDKSLEIKFKSWGISDKMDEETKFIIIVDGE